MNRILLAACVAACLGAALAAPAAQAAAPAWAPIAASGPTNLPPVQSEIQRVVVDATEGSFKLTFDGQTTAAIPFNASANVVRNRLNLLSTIGGAGGSVTVSGGPGGAKGEAPYNVSFDGGSLAETDVPELEADGSELGGGVNGIAQVFTALDGGAGTTRISVYPQNVGGLPSDGTTTTLEVGLPAGVVTEATPTGNGWSCGPAGAGQEEVTCTSTRVAGPGLTLPPVTLPVRSGPGAASGTVEVEVSGGGVAEPASYAMPLTVSEIPAPPGLQSFTAAPYTDTGAVDSRAGGHPYSASTGILVNTVRSATGVPVPAGEFRDIVVDTPPGFFGNPTATPACPEATEQEDCPHSTIVATAQVPVGAFGSAGERSAVNSIEAPFGYPAKFRFITGNRQIIVNVAAALRSDEDYGLEIGSYNTPQIQPVYGAFFTIWGTPADPAHDGQRCAGFNMETDCKSAAEVFEDEVAFLTNPVDCAEEAARPPLATINVNTWQNPGQLFSEAVPLQPVQGCDHEELRAFEAGFDFQPGSGSADSPASFTTELELPSAGLIDPEKRMNPTIRQTVIDLPEGVVLNASAADGLAACSTEQIGLLGTNQPRPNEIRFSKEPNTCPDASKIGSGVLTSSLIAEPLSAELFLAEQGEGNPFGSLFAIYLVIENPRNGIFIKLPGEVQVNQQTGRQKVVFRDLPPLPFDSLKLTLKGGARSPLATPTTCGTYTTNATNTPWSAPESGPPLVSPSAFAVNSGPNGMPCASNPQDRPLGLGLAAGSDSTQAGAASTLRFALSRPDGHQEIDTLRFDLPAGLAASLRGIPYCSEAAIAAAIGRDSGKAEQASPSCPAQSRVGRTLAGAGSGPSPFYAPGELYLAGPYKGRPLSVVAITPAVAGPFDLGNVVVRNAIEVNPITAQVSAISDPVPQIIEGVPLRVRDIRVILDRPGFGLNPTGCEEKQIGATVSGNSGATANLATRFQVGNCGALGFKPKTRLQLFGGIKRGKYQGVKAVVRPRPGDANISRSVVRFPKSAFVAQEHIRTVCTRVQFAADACPKGSIYGRAIAYSPLLDEPLKGNVYLRSSDNELPDAVADLRGPAHQPIKVEVAVRNDSVKGALRNTVQSAPDAPVSYFRLQIFGGKKGLIVNSRNICRGRNQATVAMNAHNGRRSVERVNVFNRKCKAFKRKQRKAKRGAHRSKVRAQARRGR